MNPSQQIRKGLGNRITSGLLWSVLSIAVGKGASLIAQIILGWLLSKEDFALYAIAISWSTIVMALRNGGRNAC
ncbi:MAG: oligosaccharide flippase family protein [Nitrospira sp.]|nr:oligosaccharide flippase family protein [Nitrospira sp.]